MKPTTQFAALLIFLFACHLSFAQPQSTGQLFLIEKDGKSGFIDRTGKVVITPQFDSVSGFSEGLALATRNGRKFFIDQQTLDAPSMQSALRRGEPTDRGRRVPLPPGNLAKTVSAERRHDRRARHDE